MITEQELRQKLRKIAALFEGATTDGERGMVGPLRASWMGSWYFVRQHPLYDGLPANQAMSIHYQVRSNTSNGWLVEGSGVEVVAAYARDHDRKIGAGTLLARAGEGRVVLHRITEMHPVFERRFVANALKFLAEREWRQARPVGPL